MNKNIYCKEIFCGEEWIEKNYPHFILIEKYITMNNQNKGIYVYGCVRKNKAFIDNCKNLPLDILINEKAKKIFWFIPTLSREFLFKIHNFNIIRNILELFDDYFSDLNVCVFDIKFENKIINSILKRKRVIDKFENLLLEDPSFINYKTMPEEELEIISYNKNIKEIV